LAKPANQKGAATDDITIVRSRLAENWTMFSVSGTNLADMRKSAEPETAALHV
jgi:hypothetical protein